MTRFPLATRAALAAALVAAVVTPVLALGGALKSGVDKGATLPAYHPTHVTGADKNSQTCPICKYPFSPAVQAWISGDNDKNVAALVMALDKTTKLSADSKLKVFVVLINAKHESADAMAKHASEIASIAKPQNVAIAYLADANDGAIKGYGINTDPQVKNTIFVYKNRTVNTKFVNLTANAKGVNELNEAIHQVL